MKTLPVFVSNKYNQIKNFFVGISSEDNKMEQLTLDQIESHSYIDFSKPLDEKISLEKRRRYQAYMTLDYLVSVVSYFDFFSTDSFKIAKKAKDLAQFFQKKIVTSDFLLLPFFQTNSEIINLLEKYGVHEKELVETIYNSHKITNEIFSEKILSSFKNLVIKIDIPIFSELVIITKQTKYSFEINQIFEKAAENALTRFKTPVISSEILLITMLEAKKSTVGKLLKQCLKNDTNWYMLRYCLMKRLHMQELSIRTDVPKNHQYFAYLLKAHLPELQFDMLIEKDCLLPGILLFRNSMISDIIKVDLSKELKTDIVSSMKSTNTRKYSV